MDPRGDVILALEMNGRLEGRKQQDIIRLINNKVLLDL